MQTEPCKVKFKSCTSKLTSPSKKKYGQKQICLKKVRQKGTVYINKCSNFFNTKGKGIVIYSAFEERPTHHTF